MDVLLKAVPQLRKIKDEKRRRETARDLLATSLVAAEIVQNGEALLDLAGPEPVRKVTDMSVERRGAYAVECQRLLIAQLRRLAGLSSLLEDLPVIQILDADLRRKLDALIGTKEEG